MSAKRANSNQISTCDACGAKADAEEMEHPIGSLVLCPDCWEDLREEVKLWVLESFSPASRKGLKT